MRQKMSSVNPEQPRTPKARRTRQRILDAAARLLRERGYAETTLEQISVLAELRAPTVYYYFKSREALIKEVVSSGAREGATELNNALRALPPETDPLDKLGTLIDAHLRVVTARSNLVSARIRNLSQLPAQLRKAHLREERELLSIWTGVVDAITERSRTMDRSDASTVLMLNLGSMAWASEWWAPGKRPPIDTVIRTAQIMMARGMTPSRKVQHPCSSDSLPPHDDSPEASEPKSAQTRARILRAAADIIALRQYAGTRLTDIAEAAELQYQTIYYYYETKEALIGEVVRKGIVHTRERIRETIEALPAGTTGRLKLLVAIRVHLETLLRDCPFAFVAIRNLVRLPQEHWPELMVEQDAYEAIWRRLVEEGLSDGSISQDLNAECTVMLLVGGLDMMPEWWTPDQPPLDNLVLAIQRFADAALRVW
jgi:AcrR family transcriptional regulator